MNNLIWAGIAVFGGGVTAYILLNRFKPKPGKIIEAYQDDPKVDEAIVEAEKPVAEAEDIVAAAVVQGKGLTKEEAYKIWKLLIEARVEIGEALLKAIKHEEELTLKGSCFVDVTSVPLRTMNIYLVQTGNAHPKKPNIIAGKGMPFTASSLTPAITQMGMLQGISVKTIVEAQQPNPKTTPWTMVKVWDYTQQWYMQSRNRIGKVQSEVESIKKMQSSLPFEYSEKDTPEQVRNAYDIYLKKQFPDTFI